MLRMVMVRHGRSVAVFPLHVANYGGEHRYLIRLSRGEREGDYIERGPASTLTENSGRLWDAWTRQRSATKPRVNGNGRIFLRAPLRPSVPTPRASNTEGGRIADKLRRELRHGITLSFALNVYSLRYLQIGCFALSSGYELYIKGIFEPNKQFSPSTSLSLSLFRLTSMDARFAIEASVIPTPHTIWIFN